MKRGFILLFLFLAMTQVFSGRRDDERLPQAVRERDLREVRDLISYGANVNAKDEKGRSFVMITCSMKWEDGLKALIDGGANVDAKDLSGRTPLILSTQLKWRVGVKLLIDASANLNAKDGEGKTALMYAVLNEDVTILSTILKARNIDYNIKDSDGNTAFMLAAMYHNADIIKAFFEFYEVDPFVTNVYGNNALAIAIINNNTVVTRLLLSTISTKNTYISRIPCVFWAIANKSPTRIIEMLMESHGYRELKALQDSSGHDINWYIKTYSSDSAKQKLKDMKRYS